MKVERQVQRFGHTLPGEVILRGAESPDRDHPVGPREREPKGVEDSAFVVPDGLALSMDDAVLGKQPPEGRRVGVHGLPHKEFGANRYDLNGHESFLRDGIEERLQALQVDLVHRFGVGRSRRIGTSIQRGSLTSSRNASIPISPSPMWAWRSTRLPRPLFESFA
ncbi:MAG: hypothetical protein UZ18_ATM001001962 [Armatimonadetes bacterium OLB18]|nr:MAG: hypothetical protein UZ18_ATM001001962 [Armatimonadetes bacterium OLB18]